MSVNLYNQLEFDRGYRLLQLTDDLLEAFECGPVKFKALSNDASDVVLCSEKKTWLIKQKNHSNTVLLMKEFVPTQTVAEDKISTFGLPLPVSNWSGFSCQDNELEPRLVEGSIDVRQLDVYDGKEGSLERRITLTDFKNICPCSEREFNDKWYQIGGSIVQGSACILSESFLLKASFAYCIN